LSTSGSIVRITRLDQIPGHSMYGEWALPGRPCSFVPIAAMVKQLLPGRRPVLVRLDSICAKPGNWFGTDDFSGPRFEAADIRYPGLLVQDMPNPCQLPYRMIDGRRRLEKLRRMGLGESWFHVFTFTEIEPWIRDVQVQRQPPSSITR